ncbi:MAG: hypothetical protein E7812_08865 [Phenylobacterium sp.]|nr:MAG: hypothetical protein E7812_08865 [Phenylobacterium sp.]
MLRILLSILLASAGAGVAQAQLSRRVVPNNPPVAAAPPSLTPAEADVWPFPEPDPKTWWDDPWPRASDAADPLGGRRLPRGDRLAGIDNGVDASTYRLWGLMPLQWEVLYPGEMILEVWVRPATSVRQSVVRVVVRRDGRAFVEARAGLACCEADIGRRIGFDAELPAAAAPGFLALRTHPMWQAPRMVQVKEGGATEGVCVNGVGYDVILLVPGRSRSLHRACQDAEIGQAADALEPTLRAALGHDPRFDVLYPGGINYGLDRKAYQDLIAQGGSLRPDPNGRAQPPGAEPAPRPEPPITPPAPAVAPPGPPSRP